MARLDDVANRLKGFFGGTRRSAEEKVSGLGQLFSSMANGQRDSKNKPKLISPLPEGPVPSPSTTPTSAPIKYEALSPEEYDARVAGMQSGGEVLGAATPTPMPTMAMNPNADLSGFISAPVPEDLQGLIVSAARENNIEPSLLAALLFQESRFNPGVTAGPADSLDRGIAQINARWHPEITDAQAYDPNFAIPFAAQKLRENIDQFGGDINRGIAAYNVGAGGARIAGPEPFGGGPKGQAYIDRVTRNLDPSLIETLGILRGNY